MSQLRPFVQEDQQLQEEIKSSISNAVDGMFLLAQIYIGFLDDKLTTNEIRDSLKTFQKQDSGSNEVRKTEVLSDAYDRVMGRIQQQRGGLKEMAFKVLSWVICAKRPLSVPELQHALAIKEGKLWLDQGDLPHIGDMASVCLGLITIDDSSNIVRLVHYTTQEYFTRSWEDWLCNARIEIARSCITYLSFETFESGACLNQVDLNKRLQSYSLYEYSGRHWGDHARNSQVESEEPTLDFLQNILKVYACNQAMVYILRGSSLSYLQTRGTSIKMTGLHLAASFGLRISASKLLERNSIVDATDEYGCTPLSVAAGMGYETVARLLLENNASVDSINKFGNTPLSAATEQGFETMVKLLLENGATVNHQGFCSQTPLLIASGYGDYAVAKLLLDNGATIDSRDQTGATPLSAATENGHEEVVKLLLEKQAEQKSLDTEGAQT